MNNGTLCALKSDGKILFLYRNKGEGDMHNGWYVPPGGKINRGERGTDCVVREFEEETGLKIKNPKLRVIVTFYNEGRILGGKENPEDWQVEFYEAFEFTGELRPEHPKARPIWISESELDNLKMYECDKKLFELLKQEGVYEVIVQYDKEKMIRFDVSRVA